MTDPNAERALLRDVLTWARANGWTHTCHPIHGHNWEGPRNYAVDLDATDDRTEFALDVYIPGAINCLWPRSVRQAVDVLAALGVLPAELSSMYAAGRAAGIDDAEILTDTAIDERVGLELDALLGRLDNDDTRRALADWYGGVLVDPPLLPDEPPYARRIRLEAIVEGISEILGVHNAS